MIKPNRLDIVIKDHKKDYIFIDMEVPTDCNVSLEILKKKN